MKKSLILLLFALALTNPAQAMHNEEECKSVRDKLNYAQKEAAEDVTAAHWNEGVITEYGMRKLGEIKALMQIHTACLNEKTRSLYKSDISKIKKVEAICRSQRVRYERRALYYPNFKFNDLDITLEEFEECQQKELTKLYDQKKQNKQ